MKQWVTLLSALAAAAAAAADESSFALFRAPSPDGDSVLWTPGEKKLRPRRDAAPPQYPDYFADAELGDSVLRGAEHVAGALPDGRPRQSLWVPGVKKAAEHSANVFVGQNAPLPPVSTNNVHVVDSEGRLVPTKSSEGQDGRRLRGRRLDLFDIDFEIELGDSFDGHDRYDRYDHDHDHDHHHHHHHGGGGGYYSDNYYGDGGYGSSYRRYTRPYVAPIAPAPVSYYPSQMVPNMVVGRYPQQYVY